MVITPTAALGLGVTGVLLRGVTNSAGKAGVPVELAVKVSDGVRVRVGGSVKDGVRVIVGVRVRVGVTVGVGLIVGVRVGGITISINGLAARFNDTAINKKTKAN